MNLLMKYMKTKSLNSNKINVGIRVPTIQYFVFIKYQVGNIFKIKTTPKLWKCEHVL